jgi:phosphoglycolate phosphatase-like HAD superfamily hydrolase
MNLVMFDIDGTLTQTLAIDAACYAEAVTEVSCLAAISTDWAAYRHTTDSGILDEIYSAQLGRPPRRDEVETIRELFVRKLRDAIFSSPKSFAAVTGAGMLIESLLAEGIAVSLASGGWRESARLKLATAQLRLDDLPAAFADAALARVEIMSCSYRRACAAHGVAGFDEVVYVGDGVWDAKASRHLSYKFIGVGAGERALRLTDLGAVAMFADYSDLANVMEKIRFAFGRCENTGRV